MFQLGRFKSVEAQGPVHYRLVAVRGRRRPSEARQGKPKRTDIFFLSVK